METKPKINLRRKMDGTNRRPYLTVIYLRMTQFIQMIRILGQLGNKFSDYFRKV